MRGYKRIVEERKDPNMVNLLTETVEILGKHSKTLDDIVYAGSDDGREMIPLESLLEVLNVDYNSWYGNVEIDNRLTIRLTNGDALIRWNSGGMEGWKYLYGNAKESAKTIISVKGCLTCESNPKPEELGPELSCIG